MKKKYNIQSYAKINLGLKVLFKKPNAYHHICSYITRINLHDTLKIEFLPYRNFQLTISTLKLFEKTQSSLPKSHTENTIYKTYQWLLKIPNRCRAIISKKEFHILSKEWGLKIYLSKKIPSQYGLGGGSSNAEACIEAYLLYIEDILYHDTFKAIKNWIFQHAFEIGSDVPFFLTKKAGIINGTHQKVIETIPPNVMGLLCFPNIGISTKKIYSYFSVPQEKNYDLQNISNIINSYIDLFSTWNIDIAKAHDNNKSNNKTILQKIQKKDTNSIVSFDNYLENDFIYLIAKQHSLLYINMLYNISIIKKEILYAIKKLLNIKNIKYCNKNIDNILYSSMTGSGSAFYVIFYCNFLIKNISRTEIYQALQQVVRKVKIKDKFFLSQCIPISTIL